MNLEHVPVDLVGLLAIAAGLGWASGLRLYLTLFAVGLAGEMEWVALPPALEVLQHPWVLGASGIMVLVEFLADKIPFVDSLWDTVHTFIRIPAGAALAAAVFGGEGAPWQLAMAILGGGLAASAHLAKAGARAIINVSPEPVSNVTASLGEEAMVAGALWLVFMQPLVLLALLAAFLLLAVWFIPKLWRLIRSMWRGSAVV